MGLSGQVADGDILFVTREVDETDSLVVDDFHKAFRTAPVLNIGITVFSIGGHVKAVSFLDKGYLIIGKPVDDIELFDLLVGFAAALPFLESLYGIGKSKFCIVHK